MTSEKIQSLIARENEDREDNMLRQARALINEINKEGQKIIDANARLVELRAELKALETTTLNVSDILG